MHARIGATVFMLLLAEVAAQDADPDAQAPAARFDQTRLEQLVAPIALYPDALLTQILMAATYPLEIVEADRFVLANPNLSREGLEAALADRDWDPSVKAITAVPSVLRRMSEQLEWTRDLGEAFLAQKDELLDTVQQMRAKALDAGNLKTTPEATVTTRDDKVIVVESPEPDVIYVPTYSPLVVYGGWSCPHYYYPWFYGYPGAGLGFVVYGPRLFCGGFFFGRCDWHWGHSSIFINIDIYNHHRGHPRPDDITRHGFVPWQHEIEHRRGVRYRSPDLDRQFPRPTQPWHLPQDQARGHEPYAPPPIRPGDRTPPRPEATGRPGVRPDVRPAAPPDVRPAVPPSVRPDVRQQPPPARPEGEPAVRPAVPPVQQPPRASPPGQMPRTNVPAAQPARPVGDAPRGAWSGARMPDLDRAASDRGSSSREAAGSRPGVAPGGRPGAAPGGQPGAGAGRPRDTTKHEP
jgi:hypothetical protein